MLLTEDTGIGNYHIRAYDAHSITVNETKYMTSLIVSPYRLIPDWEPQSMRELKLAHLETILALESEIVLLGTGEKFTMPSKKQLIPFYERRIGIECMSTGAACRTYTALMSEGRKVVAALIRD